MIRTRKHSLISVLVTFVQFYVYFVKSREKFPNIIYILHWTRADREPFVYWKPKRESFTSMNCEFQNCFITKNHHFFDEIIHFDVLLFNAIDLGEDADRPRVRADNQSYVFVTTDSAANFPVKGYDWFFNYTWTYKLNSDIPYPYITVRNKSGGEIVAPKKIVHWMDVKEMKPTDASTIARLKKKKTAAAWFVTNCRASSGRAEFISNLNDALAYYNLDIHIYGGCDSANFYCPRNKVDECFSKVESDYYFYLSFENSFSEDYVTEKLLTALGHYAIPVVFGGANYTRFMPDGIYLNGYALEEEALATKMHELISDKNKYFDFFKWHNHYSYHDSWDSPDSDPMCAFCAFLNGNWREKRRVYARFDYWWNETGHNVPQNDEEGIIVHFEKPYTTYYSYWAPTVHQKTESILDKVSEFVGKFSEFLDL